MTQFRRGAEWAHGVERGQAWVPSADPDALRLRAWFNRLVREFFHARNVLEVETPILSRAGNSDPNIASFSLCVPGRGDAHEGMRWLRTSPEFPLKRLLAAGVGDCYELGRVFRAGEVGGRHNPEFTMLEWYRLGMDHHQLAEEVVELVQTALSLVGQSATPVRTSYRELYRDALGLDPFTATDDALAAALGDVLLDPAGLGRDDWLDLLMTHRIQPGFAEGQLRVVTGYPASQCALARVEPGEDGVPTASRFEVYLGPLELANGYHELRDAREQRRRFEADLALRRQRGDEAPALDERLLAALAHGLPDCAGVALGVDRLLMRMLGVATIGEVLAFDAVRA
jgi:lysyl-tRNA synthetase class 2